MDKMNIQKPDKIILAGAFGTHIDVKYALLLGLLPDCNLKNVRSAGNAAGTGARIALLNQSARKEIEKQVKKINKIETALEKAFQDHFVNAMGIPHTTDDYSMLKQVVEFPVEDISQNTRRRRRG
jgi:uncharacterized 2Fe-2S/4Fe-4S cluster protein (DUF4445 family)